MSWYLDLLQFFCTQTVLTQNNVCLGGKNGEVLSRHYNLSKSQCHVKYWLIGDRIPLGYRQAWDTDNVEDKMYFARTFVTFLFVFPPNTFSF